MYLKADLHLVVLGLLFVGCTSTSGDPTGRLPAELTFPILLSDLSSEILSRPVVHRVNHSVSRVRRGDTILLYPGTDQLQPILNRASSSSVIRLMPGLHSESHMLRVEKPIRLIGSPGTILALGGTIGMYIREADGVLLHRLEIKNTGSSRLAIAGHRAGNLRISHCDLSGFPMSLVLEDCTDAAIRQNVILGTGQLANDVGILVMNGTDCSVRSNEVYGTAFGIWLSGQSGFALDNYTHDNLVGMLLSRVPPGSIPFGRSGSLAAATHWEATGNRSERNAWGILLMDGANHNLLADNQLVNNALADIELTSASRRPFGFPAAGTFSNVVYTRNTNIRIIDCGADNQLKSNTDLRVTCQS